MTTALRASLVVAVLLLLLLNSCVSPRQRALRQAQRYTQKVLDIYARYPDLRDSVSVVTVDSLRTPARLATGQWARPTDTTAYDQLLVRYVHLSALAQMPASNPARPKTSPAPVTTDRSALDKEISQLRAQLRLGAYQDSVYSYSDQYLAATVTIKGGKIAWSYTLKPQSYGYIKTINQLAPVAALPEDCQPKRFWQDWLFWVLLLLAVVVRVCWRTFWTYVQTLLPR